MPLESPVELGISHTLETLVHIRVIVAVIILEDDHLDVGQRTLVVG